MAVSGAASVEHELGLSHQGYVTFAFALPLVAAAAIEAGLALLSDVWGRHRLVLLGQVGLAAALGFTAWTSSPWGLTLGLALAGASSGVACAAAQALLVTSSGGSADRAMVRWALCCALGDVLAPLVTASALALGHSYRGAMGVIAVAVAAQGVLSAGLRPRAAVASDAASTADHPAAPLRAALAQALRLPRLWTWLAAAASCTLLDELVIALAVLRLARDRATTAAPATAAAVAFAAGSVVGSAVTDRIVARVGSRRVLVASAIGCAAALLSLIASTGAASACAALFVVGVTAAPHHPLAMAAAYDALPENPGTVQAMGQLFVVVDVLAPLALGAIADRLGLDAAIASLLAQPALVLLCAALAGRRPAPASGVTKRRS